MQFESVRLCIRHLYLHESTLLQVSKMIEAKGGVTYPLRHVSSRTFYVSSGRKSIPEHSLFLTSIPRLVFVAFIPADNFTGSATKSLFTFKHYDLTNLTIETSTGETFPARPYSIDFEKRLYTRAYYDLMDSLNYVSSSDTCSITPATFVKNNNIFVIDLGCSRDPSMMLLRSGETVLKANFAKPIPDGGMYIQVLASFDQTLHVDPRGVGKIDIIA